MKILFICHGNICRSPMAEFICKHMVAERGLEHEYYIESAAVSSEEIGNGIYPPARSCLNRHGVLFNKCKTARKVTLADYEDFDRLICMDSSNLRLLRRIIGEDTQGKVSLMMSYAGMDDDVADPWYTGDFERTYQNISTACAAMLLKDQKTFRG
jgi:protein-tyrosine phosphatase